MLRRKRVVTFHNLKISLVSNLSYSKHSKKTIHTYPTKQIHISTPQPIENSKINKDIIHIFNSLHLGDNVFNILSLNKLSNYLDNKNIFIHYYLKDEYIKQIQEFVKNPRIILKSNKNIPSDAFNMWIGDRAFQFNYLATRQIDKYKPLNDFYVKYHNECFKQLRIPIEIKTIAYEDPSLLDRYDSLHPIYKNIDVLLINAIPQSGQFTYNYNQWLSLCRILLQNNINIVTTEKILNVKCTRDRGLSIRDIAAISTNVKVIVSINSGVCPGLFNSYTLNNVSRFYIFDKYAFYSFKNFVGLVNFNYLPINEIIKIVKLRESSIKIIEEPNPEIDEQINESIKEN